MTYVVVAVDGGLSPRLARSIREADRVVGNSRFVTQTVEDRFGISAGTVYDGIKTDVFYPAKGRQPASRLSVLYAGSFQARKRVNVIIREAAKWPAAEFRLAGRGEPDEEEKCRSLVKELGCNNVTFVGHLSQRGLAEEMRKADVFLFPSVLEGHPQVLGQAAACGLPIVAMDLYRPDFVLHGETGYLARSEAEVSHWLGVLLSDAELRVGMSKAAARYALQFDWDKVTRDWEAVLVEAMQRRKK